jgi:hypothetical protein
MGRLISLLLCVMFAMPVSAQTIKKCQDAEGKWHYGDHAALECEQKGRITEINEKGDTVGSTEAPPTQEELDAKMRAEEQASEQEEAEDALKRLDQRLLITYDSSESILLTRDALLAAIDSATEADQILRDRLDDELKKLEANGDEADAGSIASLKLQIEDFNEAIRNRLAKREIAKSKYDMEYNRYKGLIGN